MKSLVVEAKTLKREARWDIDYHLPPVEIQKFPPELVGTVRDVADAVKAKRDPTQRPDVAFQYVDIASVDVETGTIARPQELTGAEAPSRARKVIRAYDLIISTCRPTRGAVAIVPEQLHGQICSTGFSVIRAKEGINPFYLHFVLRLWSTLEQFRKWSTGSSYPAILDEDVLKTRIPVLQAAEQDEIAKRVRVALAARQAAILAADSAWEESVASITGFLKRTAGLPALNGAGESPCTIQEISARLAVLGPVEESGIMENGDGELILFEDEPEA